MFKLIKITVPATFMNFVMIFKLLEDKPRRNSVATTDVRRAVGYLTLRNVLFLFKNLHFNLLTCLQCFGIML